MFKKIANNGSELLIKAINWAYKTARRGLIGSSLVGYVLTLLGMTIEDIIHGLDFIDAVTDFHHHIFPILLGILTGILGYSLGKEWERKKSETEELTIEKEKYRDLFENNHDSICVVDKNGNYIDINQATEKLTGYSKIELLKMNIADLVYTEDQKKSKEQIAKLFKVGFYKNYEGRIITKNGELRCIEVNSNIIEKNGKIIGSRDTVRDTTSRKRGEKLLKESEEKYRTLTENVNIGIFRTSKAGKFFETNPAFEEIFGYDRKELSKMMTVDLYEEPGYREEFLKKIDEKGLIKNEELKFKRKDGTIIIGSLTIKAIKDNNGDVLYFDGIVDDVSERIKTVNALKKTKEQFKQVTEQSPSVFELYDIHGLQIDVNNAYEKLWNFSEGRATTVGKFNVLKSKEVEKTGLLASVKKSYAGETVTLPPYKFDPSGKTEAKGEGRVRWLSTKIYPLKDGKGEVTNIVITHEDISDRVYAEEENKKLQEQLRQGQKIEAIGTLTGGIAHDFNNILGALSGFNELSMMEIDENSNMWANMDEIRKATVRATTLTKQLLAFSRKQNIEPKIVDINDQINELWKMLTRIVGEDIDLVKEFKETKNIINADIGQIQQIFMNLIINASYELRKMKNGALRRITITTGSVELTEANCIINNVNMQNGKYSIIKISDTGPGISEDIIDKIFDPFFTTKEFGRGTGLGLSTVYGIVKQNNGYIWVDSQKGEGAIFTIYWPLASIQEYKTYEDRPRKLIKGTETILMVEDEPQVLDIGTRILKKSGYNIIKAPNAEKGIEIINSYKGKIDMLFTDVILPGKDGIDCAKEFTKKRPEGVVLFSSGYTNDRLEEKGFNEKKVNMIFKPYNVERLTSKVAELFKVQ